MVYGARLENEGIAGSIPGTDIYFHFEFFASFPYLTARRSPCKWNQAWPLTCSVCCFRPQTRLIIRGLSCIWLQYSFKSLIHWKVCREYSLRGLQKAWSLNIVPYPWWGSPLCTQKSTDLWTYFTTKASLHSSSLMLSFPMPSSKSHHFSMYLKIDPHMQN